MSESNSSQAMSERAQHLLRVLIERYIRDGEPVGSNTLARDTSLDLSPATIRNVIADLEDMGFVTSPHTSAGRMPTVQGYRFFVDTLLTVEPLQGALISKLRHQLGIDMKEKDLIERASSMLSGLTQFAGIVTLPRYTQPALRHIDFVALSQRRILVILVINDHEVQNRIIHTDRDYSSSELETTANYLNAEYAGRGLAEVRHLILNEMQKTREDMNHMMLAAVDMANRVFEEVEIEKGEDFVMAGQTNLMDVRELCDVKKLRHLFDAFNQKRELLHLLDSCISAKGVQIFIGGESGYQVLDDCSLVTSPYSVDGKTVGVLGVIGPTRMAYERVISIVDTTSRLLGAALNPTD